jgi:elongation factor G
MSQHRVEDLRNIVVCGHGSAGKTTLVDRLLQKTGAVPQAGAIDLGTSVCDFDDEEKHHKYSIESTLVHFTHAGKMFQAIDTPGYPDFIGQVIGAMRAVETALICINAHSGIAVNTRRVFHEAGAAGLGRIVAITKLDTENIDFPKLLGQIKDLFGACCVPLNVPVGVGHDLKGVVSTLKPPGDAHGAVVDAAAIHTALVESIVEIEDEVMARYFEGTEPTGEEFARLIVEAVAQGKLIPIVCVATKQDIGLTE